MKKKLAVVMAVILMLAMGSMLIACNPATELDAPVISISGSTISWDAVDHADKYVVFKGETEAATVTETRYIINESVPGTYEFTVMAQSDDDRYSDSKRSNEVEYEVKAKKPEATQLTKPAIELEGNKISWEAVSNADKYIVYKDGVELITVTALEYTITETEVGTYKFTVKASSDSENFTDSELSNEVEYKITVQKTQLTKPAIGLEGNKISWEAVSNADKYVVYKDGVELTTTTATEYTITETKVGTYRFTVRARSDSENYIESALSNVVEYTVSPSEITTVTLAQLIKSIDLTEGLKIEGDIDVNILAALTGAQTQELYDTFTGTIIASILVGDEFDLDLKLDVNRGTDFQGKIRTYIRGNKLYSSSPSAENGEEIISDDDMIFDVSTDSTGSTNSILAGIPEIISQLSESQLVNYLGTKITFVKEGDAFKAKIDVVDILSRLITKVESFLETINDDTTLSELYEALDIKNILDAVVGTQPLKDIYAGLRTELLKVNPQMQLPENLDGQGGLIEMLQQMFEANGMEGNLPAVGNLSASEYMDEVLKEFGDRTLDLFAEWILNFMNPGDPEQPGDSGQGYIPEQETNPGQSNDPAQGNGSVQKTAVTNGDVEEPGIIESLKQTIKGFIDPIKQILSLNTLKIEISADAQGKLSSIALEVKLDQSIMALISGSESGVIKLASTDDGNGEDDQNVNIIEGTVTLNFTHGNVTLASDADIANLKTLDKVIEPHLGEYTVESVEVKVNGQTIDKDQYSEYEFVDLSSAKFEIVKNGDNGYYSLRLSASDEWNYDQGIWLSDSCLKTDVLFYGSAKITFEDDGSITLSGMSEEENDQGKITKEFVITLQKAEH